MRVFPQRLVFTGPEKSNDYGTGHKCTEENAPPLPAATPATVYRDFILITIQGKWHFSATKEKPNRNPKGSTYVIEYSIVRSFHEGIDCKLALCTASPNPIFSTRNGRPAGVTLSPLMDDLLFRTQSESLPRHAHNFAPDWKRSRGRRGYNVPHVQDVL